MPLPDFAAYKGFQVFPGRNVIIWEGPSQITGAPIFVIVSATSRNRKIGEMAQAWILPADRGSIEAVRTGKDDAICGSCQHRGIYGQKRSCYVGLRGPETIYRHRKNAGRETAAEFAEKRPGLQLRIGAYGDPVAVPAPVWDALLATASGWTAYTHAWRTAPEALRRWCMASVDTEDEQREASAAGWRTFRVRPLHTPLLRHEIMCPASEEAGHKAVCASCSLCRGAARAAKNIVITAHGTGMKWFGSRHLGFDVAP